MWQVVVYFRVVISANFVNICSEKVSSSSLKSHVSHTHVTHMKHCWWDVVHFRVVYCSNLEHWAPKWQNLKRLDWQIKRLSIRHCDRHLSQFDFFEQTFDWQPCSNSRSANHISDHVFKFFSGPMMCNSDFWSLLTSQNVLWRSACFASVYARGYRKWFWYLDFPEVRANMKRSNRAIFGAYGKIFIRSYSTG